MFKHRHNSTFPLTCFFLSEESRYSPIIQSAQPGHGFFSPTRLLCFWGSFFSSTIHIGCAFPGDEASRQYKCTLIKSEWNFILTPPIRLYGFIRIHLNSDVTSFWGLSQAHGNIMSMCTSDALNNFGTNG
jgi:hypothetical protein